MVPLNKFFMRTSIALTVLFDSLQGIASTDI